LVIKKNTIEDKAEMPKIAVRPLFFLRDIPSPATKAKLPQVNKTTSCIPINISLIIIRIRGTIKEYFLLRYAPEKIAIAQTGVKLGGWGTSLDKIPAIIKTQTNINSLLLVTPAILIQIDFTVKIFLDFNQLKMHHRLNLYFGNCIF